MNNSNIRWKSFDRDLVPLALFGDIGDIITEANSEALLTIPQGKVAIGFPTENINNYTPPALLVFNENNSSEILAWLRVYSPDTSPVSQFTRVLTSDDWALLTKLRLPLINKTARTDQWSCVVLGELLAQSESYTDISSVPLSRAHACFSTAISQASLIYSSKEITKICIDRLQTLEIDQRFVKRTLTLSDLSAIWNILESFKTNKNASEEDSLYSILETIKHSSHGEPYTQTSYLPDLKDFPDLNSNSIEARVTAFNSLLNQIYTLSNLSKQNIVVNATLAAAAFLVGRSTSHIFLLRRIGKEFPSSFAWFGLFAAVCGASAWDSEWARATKGIERSLRMKFDWSNPALVDLCWAEYNWMAQTPNSENVFSDIPKLSPRVLSIEIVAGATCQLLLTGGVTGRNIENKKLIEDTYSLENTELRNTIEKFIELAARAKDNLLNTKPQESFKLEDPSSLSRPSRVKKAARTTTVKK